MNDKKPWAQEPTPICDANEEHISYQHSRDLERRLRHANALIGKLRADMDCGDFDKDDLEQRLANIEETLTP